MSQKVNIKTIAELSGVSVATVSRVINQNGRFSAETEARVRRVIEECNYIPNTVAKGLRENHTKVIGVIVPDITNAHFSRLVLEMEMFLFEHGYSTMICNTNESKDLEKRHIETLLAQRVSGIIIISGKRHYMLDDLPVIYVDRRPEEYEQGSESVVIESDNKSGGYIAAKKLLEKGCTRLAILYASQVDFNQRMRHEGYIKAVEEAGVKSYEMDIDRISVGAARAAVIESLEKGVRWDGIVCTTDMLAIGAMQGLKHMNQHIPEDVKVTGYDDSAIAALCEPTLTSIHQKVKIMAETAGEVMLQLIAGEDIQEKYRLIPVRLIERETTG